LVDFLSFHISPTSLHTPLMMRRFTDLKMSFRSLFGFPFRKFPSLNSRLSEPADANDLLIRDPLSALWPRVLRSSGVARSLMLALLLTRFPLLPPDSLLLLLRKFFPFSPPRASASQVGRYFSYAQVRQLPSTLIFLKLVVRGAGSAAILFPFE